jgi:predicted nucleic acid-binding protein
MTSVQLIADTNVVSYMFRRSTLGIAYADLIDSRPVGLTGHTVAELRAGTVIGCWGERRLNEHSRFLERFTDAMAHLSTVVELVA